MRTTLSLAFREVEGIPLKGTIIVLEEVTVLGLTVCTSSAETVHRNPIRARVERPLELHDLP